MNLGKHLIWLAPLLVLDFAALVVYLRRPAAPVPDAGAPPATSAPADAGGARSQFNLMVLPTEQTALLDDAAENVFQPTASGRPESALYGSTRTRQEGRRIFPSFHEGLDIAPCRRDRRGRALDLVCAVAAGRVAYINRIAGNSNYGKYVVLTHDDQLGEIYTLYAHLSEIADGLRAGQSVDAGKSLGIMGHTSSSPIPAARAHLHLETGVILNRRFDRWYRAQKLKPNHGVFHGWNLLGIDPLAVLQAARHTPDFTFHDHLAGVPAAFEVVLATRALPDYFTRHPALWRGAPFAPPAMVVVCSENGVPLAGRNATADETRELGKSSWLVRNVDDAVLGRNGARLIRRHKGRWDLARNGLKWRNMLLF